MKLDNPVDYYQTLLYQRFWIYVVVQDFFQINSFIETIVISLDVILWVDVLKLLNVPH